MEDIDIQLLSDSPGPSRIGIGGNSFVQNTGGGQGQWPIDDIGMARDPADVGHAPIDIFGMDVLNIFGGPGHIGQIASDAVLTALGLTRCSARVHHKERILRRQGNRVDSNSLIVLQHLVREVVTPFNHRGLGGVFSRVASENQNLVDTLALLLGHLHGDIGVLLVIQQLTRAIVAIDGDQDTASGVGDPLAAGFPTESPIDFRMDHPQSGTGQHGNGKLGGHRHMQCDSIPRLQPGKVSEKCRQLIDPHIEFLKSEGHMGLILGLRHKNKGRLVFVLLEVSIDAVVAGIDLAPHEPLPAGSITGIQRGVPILVPAEKIGIFLVAFRKVIQAEPLIDLRIGHVCLSNKGG